MNINSMKLTKMEKELIDYLHENDYSKNTKSRYRSVFSYIRKIVSSADPVTYEEVLTQYKKEHVCCEKL